MSILSNLSRRFHMLTTDAKPDPPRVPIKGYTHNLESINNETKKSNATTESQFTRNDITFEKNDAIPVTNVNSPTKEQHNLNNIKSSAHDSKEHTKPNIKTKKKPKQYKSSQGTHVINYNIINSNDVKIGPRTSYICNINQLTKNKVEEDVKSKTRQMPIEVERLCTCNDEITLDDIFTIKTYIGHGWKDVARKLLYLDGQIEQFEENYKYRGISEVIYQIFLDWKQANTKDAEIGKLINILWTCKEYDCAERLVSVRKNLI